MVLVKWDLHLLPNKCIQTINVTNVSVEAHEVSHTVVNANGTIDAPVMVGGNGNLDSFLASLSYDIEVGMELEVA